MRIQLKELYSSKLVDTLFNILLPIISVVAALLIGSVMLRLLNVNPVEAYESLINGATGLSGTSEPLKINARAETVIKSIPLLFVGIGICIAFRAGVINIGGEGQMMMGAVIGTILALQLEEIPRIFTYVPWNDFPQVATVSLVLTAGFIGGALWGGIAGALKAYFNVNEILSTIMLNQIALQIMIFLLNGPIQDPRQRTRAGGIAKTIKIPEHARLPRLTFLTDVPIRLHAGIFIAIGLAIIIYILLWRTTYGYRLRAVGKNIRAARYAGINVKRQIVYAMLWSGGFAGLAGIVQVTGLQYVLQTEGSAADFTGNAGFNGIVTALFGGLHPIGTIPASIFFGGLLIGGQAMQRAVQIEASLITALNGLIVVFVVSSQIVSRHRSRRRVNSSSSREEPANAK